MITQEITPVAGDDRGGRNTNTGTSYSTPKPAGIEGLLHRLDGIKSTGADSWTAKCPAHPDKSPSLSIKDTGDRVLIHCHAGCSTEAVVQAVGLELRDLFNKPLPAADRRRMARIASRMDLEAAANHELIILAQTLGNRVADRPIPRDRMPPEWRPMPAGFWERELVAAKRLLRLLPLIYGSEVTHG